VFLQDLPIGKSAWISGGAIKNETGPKGQAISTINRLLVVRDEQQPNDCRVTRTSMNTVEVTYFSAKPPGNSSGRRLSDNFMKRIMLVTLKPHS